MKKILIILFSVCAISAQAQFVFKVQPKVFLGMKNDTITVTGIVCKFVGNIELDLSNDTLYHRTFYIGFKTSKGDLINTFNTSTILIVEDMLKVGVSPETAYAQINSIIKALEFGTASQKFNAAQILANKYGYGLLPLNQQE